MKVKQVERSLGLKEKLALWVLWRWFTQGEKLSMESLKNYGVEDWARIIANIAISAGGGYAAGGWIGFGIAIAANLGALLQPKPGNISVPKSDKNLAKLDKVGLDKTGVA